MKVNGRVANWLRLAVIVQIREAVGQNWDSVGPLLSEQFKLRVLYLADKPDPNAIVEQQKKVDELRRMRRGECTNHWSLATSDAAYTARQSLPASPG